MAYMLEYNMVVVLPLSVLIGVVRDVDREDGAVTCGHAIRGKAL